MVLNIKGDIIGNELKEVYEWFGFEYVCPNDVHAAIEALPESDVLTVKINSGGGDVLAGQEIYAALRERSDVRIEVESMAGSAASIIAMAGHCSISPIGMLMIHNVSSVASGNKRDMKKEAEVLEQFDNALASAYIEKTGMPRDEILKLMDKETWLTAEKALELGFVDEITAPAAGSMTNAFNGMQVTADMIERFSAHKAKEKYKADLKAEILKDLDKFGEKGQRHEKD